MVECRSGKTTYRTAGDAREALRGAKRAGRGADCHLFVYKCHVAEHYHVSSRTDLFAAFTPPKTTAKVAAIPSAAKLRRKLQNAGAQILAYQKRLDAADAATKKAEEAHRRAVDAACEEREAIAAMTDRLFGSAK
jgi:hypothetical protein